MNGIIIVNKPENVTSQDVLTTIKKILKPKKIGHAGTLDPLATGVLIVLLNDATKLSDYLMLNDKEYIAKIQIGISTTTEDATGDIVKQVVVEQLDSIDRVLKSFVGSYHQKPPMYSALKKNGKKLYEYAREGIEIERETRNVEIFDIQYLKDIVYENNSAAFSFRVKVSKGTYIRTLCVDIGKKLCYPAHMQSLHRISSGKYHIEDAYTIENIRNGSYRMIPMIDAIENFPKIIMDDALYKKVKNGVRIPSSIIDTYVSSGEPDRIALVYLNQLVAIYKKVNEEYQSERVWN